MQNSYNNIPRYCGVFAEVDPKLYPLGHAIATHDNEARANIPARHFEAGTPAFDKVENAMVPSMQHTMKEENIHPNGNSLSSAWGSLSIISVRFIYS